MCKFEKEKEKKEAAESWAFCLVRQSLGRIVLRILSYGRFL